MLTRLLVIATLVGASWQDPPVKEPKEPGRGDTVTVKGCLTGGVLESSDLSTRDRDGNLHHLITFRLTGDKKTLEQIRKEHSGHRDIVVGELESDLPSVAPRGKRIGKTNITIGIGASQGMGRQAPPPMPVLKVKTFEHTEQRCRQ